MGNYLGSNSFAALFEQGLDQARAQNTNPSTSSFDATGSPAPNSDLLPNSFYVHGSMHWAASVACDAAWRAGIYFMS